MLLLFLWVFKKLNAKYASRLRRVLQRKISLTTFVLLCVPLRKTLRYFAFKSYKSSEMHI